MKRPPIQFLDKLVTYDTFVNDVAAKVVHAIKEDSNDPEFISQRRAYAMFGRSNVDRWRKQGLVQPTEHPGKMEYRTSDLRLLQRRKNDKRK